MSPISILWAVVVGLMSTWVGAYLLKPLSGRPIPKNYRIHFQLMDMYVLVTYCFFIGWAMFSIESSNAGMQRFMAIVIIWALMILWWWIGLGMLARLENPISWKKRAIFLYVIVMVAHGGPLFPFIITPSVIFLIESKEFNKLTHQQEQVLAIFIWLLIPIMSLAISRPLACWMVLGQPEPPVDRKHRTMFRRRTGTRIEADNTAMGAPNIPDSIEDQPD